MSLSLKFQALLKWSDEIPQSIKFLAGLTGFCVSAFSSQLPDSWQSAGLWVGLCAGATAFGALVLHAVKGLLVKGKLPGDNPSAPGAPAPPRITLDRLYEFMVAAGPGASDKERLDKFDKMSIELHDALGSSPGVHAYGRKISGNWVDDLVDHIPGLMQVPLKFWTDGGDIEWHTVDATKQRGRCVARQIDPSARGEPGYFDLQFDRDQIARLWPQLKLLSDPR